MSLGLILAGIFIGVPVIVFGLAFVSAIVETNSEKREAEERANTEYKNLYDKILQSKFFDEKAKIKGEIKELPQLTFEKWLTLYNASPEHWDMKDFFTKASNIPDGYNYLIPTYYKTTYQKDSQGKDRKVISNIGIPIFWASANEMRKFDNWMKNEFKQGKASGYERMRDKSLEELTTYLQEDVKERREQLQRDYVKIVDEVGVQDSNIKLVLQESSK